MKIRRVVVRHVRVGLLTPFRTASLERTESDSVIVEVVPEAGGSGFGEGVPREYVTGETAKSCFDHLRSAAAGLAGTSCASFAEAVELAGELGFGPDPLRPRCAARSALELALLDAAGRSFGVPLARLVEFLPDLSSVALARDEVRYGAVMPVGSSARSALARRLYGFRDVKLKAGPDVERSVEFVARMRRWLGRKVDLRVDANGSWPPADVPRIMRRIEKFGVSFIEQPVRPPDLMQLAELRSKCAIPVMLDESLVSERDAQLAVDGKLCDAFNLRVSKNGGMIPVLRLAKLAIDNRVGIQLGCHPGETSILSAAGRAIACSVRGLLYLEGSYDRHVLRRRLTREDITFGLGGRARRLSGPGLGVTVLPARLDADTVERLDIA
jgi:L-alanine-DL-glutamate epimerase-like enolase superfamily enzyme